MKTTKNKRSILAIIMIAVLMAVTSFAKVNAETIINYEYTELNDGTIAVDLLFTGTMDMTYLSIPSEIDGYTVSAVIGRSGPDVREVKLPATIKTIGDYDYISGKITEKNIFACDNAKLQRFVVDAENPYLTSYSGVLFNKDKTKIIAYPPNRLDSSYKLPSSVEVIGNHAFNYCKDINEITIPDGVKIIEEGAFANCEYLRDLKLPNSITEIGSTAFWDCASFREIVIPDKVTKLNGSTFTWCDNLRKLTIPKSVKEISSGMIAEFTGIFDKLTIYGYSNSEAEKYANSKNIKFVSLGNATVDEEKVYVPNDFLQVSFEEIISIFGNDYKEVTENGSGLTKYIYYPNTGNPFEFGFDYNTNRVIAIYVYDFSETPIKLFDDITNKSLLADIENSKTAYPYTKSYDYSSGSDIICFSLENDKMIKFEWINNDINKQSADRVLVFQKKSEEETTTKPKDTESATNATNNATNNSTTNNTTKPSVNPTSSTAATSNVSTNDTATVDNISNGTIQTGVVASISAVLLLLIGSTTIFGYAWYSRKRDKK